MREMENGQGASEISRRQDGLCRDCQSGMQDEINAERRPGMSDDALGKLLDILRQRGETVTTVESLTAGLIAARIADIPGASDVMKRAYVTYCDEAKHEMVGVSRQTLETYTAVSAQTAQEMALGGRSRHMPRFAWRRRGMPVRRPARMTILSDSFSWAAATEGR